MSAAQVTIDQQKLRVLLCGSALQPIENVSIENLLYCTALSCPVEQRAKINKKVKELMMCSACGLRALSRGALVALDVIADLQFDLPLGDGRQRRPDELVLQRRLCCRPLLVVLQQTRRNELLQSLRPARTSATRNAQVHDTSNRSKTFNYSELVLPLPESHTRT